MTFVVVENCIKCKHTDCVEVCPVDCFYEGPNFLVIHPDECIDCALCEPECPVDAIFSEDELPDDQQQFIELNAELRKSGRTSLKRRTHRPTRMNGTASKASYSTWSAERRWPHAQRLGRSPRGSTGLPCRPISKCRTRGASPVRRAT